MRANCAHPGSFALSRRAAAYDEAGEARRKSVTRWWKCDLQVATPHARDFRGPTVDPWDLQTDAGRTAAAARYMERLREVGMELVVLADHNDASWLPIMKAAGEETGIVVFPGVEVTTGSGADGIHLIIVGDPAKTVADFEALLSGACGFGGDHPRFDPVLRTPTSSPNTILQILDRLPEGFLALAPHAFNDNGICARNTVRGDLRWKALHHDRLGAVDVGDPSTIDSSDSWRSRFVRRDLDNFPRLASLPFVSTSDAYCLDDLGTRFTWLRMAEPTLEAMRQAFLDHEARIVCDWDGDHPSAPSPNTANHARVETLRLEGLSTSTSPLEIEFDPRLNVVIGGRGSGKSTLVTALRLLYGEADRLPEQAQAEFESMREAVFFDARASASHRLAHSDEQQSAAWSQADGSTTTRTSQTGPITTSTDFKVRVINQKELFERAAHSAQDPTRTSRNLLALVDDSLAVGSAGPGGPAAFASALEEAQTAWIGASIAHRSEVVATAQRDVVAARVEELRRQVAAFDSAESQMRRARNDLRAAQWSWWETRWSETDEALAALRASAADLLAAIHPDMELQATPAELADSEFLGLHEELNRIREATRDRISQLADATNDEINDLAERVDGGTWRAGVLAAEEDQRRYVGELAEVGVDPAEYDRVRRLLASEQSSLEELDRRRTALPELLAAANAAWREVEHLLDERRHRRRDLLDEVASRSQHIQFVISPAADQVAWATRVRELLNLRADGFLADVPALGGWLWGANDADGRSHRLGLWREACISGDMDAVAEQAGLRPSWTQRLVGLDAVLRARLGSEVAEDVIAMEFLREGGDPLRAADWRPLTSGSPGQRSAAMLSFVLHHGVEPLVLDQPEDDLDTEWISDLVVPQLRVGRWARQIIVITHNANIPVNADAERIVVMEGHDGGIRVRTTQTENGAARVHAGAVEQTEVRRDIQRIMEGGVAAFVRRERRYNNELNTYRAALRDRAEAED